MSAYAVVITAYVRDRAGGVLDRLRDALALDLGVDPTGSTVRAVEGDTSLAAVRFLVDAADAEGASTAGLHVWSRILAAHGLDDGDGPQLELRTLVIEDGPQP